MYFLIHKLNDMCRSTSQQTTTSYRDSNGRLYDLPVKKIYDSPPHGTADNHFSGEHVLDLAGGLGFGLTLTTRRDRFPPGLKPFCHHDKTAPGCTRAKCMRFGNPIVAVKQVPATDSKKAYTKTLVSFQSTGATNISGVNNLHSEMLRAVTRTRGTGSDKRIWAIEWNVARGTYLAYYWAVDNVDHMIKNAGMRFISCKYWHAPYNHGHAIAVIAAYDIYRYCCDGRADPEWAIAENKRLSFRDFRMRLSSQMLDYDPKEGLLPGDENFRATTKYSKMQKANRKRKMDYNDGGVTEENYNIAKGDKRTRLCGDLDQLLSHTKTMYSTRNYGKCEVCGRKCLYKCRRCEKYMCVLDKKSFTGGECMLRFHSDTFFGLAREDNSMHETSWKAPNENTIRRHAEYVRTTILENESDQVLGNNVETTAV